MTYSFNPPSNNLYPTLDDPDDEELQRALKLSIITVKEDEARRNQYRIPSSSSTLRTPDSYPQLNSTFNNARSKFEADRPLPGVTGAIPRPRPDPTRGVTGNDLNRDASLTVFSLPKPIVPVTARQPTATRATYSSDSFGSSAAAVASVDSRNKLDRVTSDPRLIPLPPRPTNWNRSHTPDPTAAQQQQRQPDLLESIPVIPLPPRPDVRSRAVVQALPGAERSHSVPPQIKTDHPQETNSASILTPSNDSDVPDTFLIQLSPPGCPTVHDFDVATLDPFFPKNVSPSSVAGKAFTPLSTGPSSNKFQALVAPVLSRGNIVQNPLFNTGGFNMPGAVKNPAYSLLWPIPTNQAVVNQSNAVIDVTIAETLSRNSSMSQLEINNDDLMFFNEDKDDPIYLSLQDFDPLYSMDDDRKSVDSKCSNFDSIGIFQSPSKSGMMTMQSKILDVTPTPTPTPTPTLTSTWSSSVASHSSIIADEMRRGKNERSSKDVVSSSDYEELLDPFSFSDLTLSLERKRQKHTIEQELRKTLRRKDEEEKLMNEKENSKVTQPLEVTVKSVGPKESSYEMLTEYNETADSEIEAFLQMVARIKRENSAEDAILSNAGFVISPRTKHIQYYDLTVKVTVFGSFFPEPVIFTCDVNTLVEHVVTHVLVMLNDDLGGTSADDFLLKVHGLSEYLINNSILADYEFVQECLKLDKDIRFVLSEFNLVSKPFQRNTEDDKHAVFVPKMRPLDGTISSATRNKLNILMETFYKEVEKLRDATIQGIEKTHCKGVVQAVKALCVILNEMETVDIMKALQRLQSVVLGQPFSSGFVSGSTSPRNRESYVCVSDDANGYTTVQIVPENSQRRSDIVTMLDDLHIALDEVTKAVKSMIEMYCEIFHTDFRFESSKIVTKEARDVTSLQENLILHVASVHRIPSKWRQVHMEYRVKVGLFYGGKPLTDEMISQPVSPTNESQQGRVIWDEWMMFDKIFMGEIPRETKVVFSLIGVRVVPSNNSEGHMKVNTPLGWVAMQLFNQKFELVQGSRLLGLWLGNSNPNGTTISNTEQPQSVLLQVNLPRFDYNYVFPAIENLQPSVKHDFDVLDHVEQSRLQSIIEKDVLTSLTKDEVVLLWDKRHYLYKKPNALPRVLQTLDTWSANYLPEIYSMIQDWSCMAPWEGLQLLLPCYADSFIRSKAVNQLRDLSSDQLYDLLPQLVQALKFESYHTSALSILLLERAESNVRVAHQLYWLLKEAADNIQYRKRYQLMFGALLSVVGKGMREEFQKQEDLVKMLASIADKVKASKDKESVLQHELYNMWEFLQHKTVRLPINAAIEITGVDVKSCSFFTSFTCPLKLALKNVDLQAGNVYTMFKAGDDLRQDVLTLQMIRIMDHLWMHEGLDLKMMTFRCQPTALKRGLVELLMESDTLRKIQMKHGHGLAGSFKERTIAEFLQNHNPTELDYQKAVDNFTESCAGYCVATYILGIGDRHNDNIMIKHSGHIFHIDFAKYLGDSQKFGNFKRDRSPFVLTSDMAYVINGGDRSNEKFQHFIDLCCRAFNIIRKNGNLFLTLFSLMTLSGIPGITEDAPKYIQKVLLTEKTDAQAVADFTRMINTSLESTFTQLNFFLHNLAQMRFSGHEEGALLSFIPKTYSIETDGKIRSLEMHGIQKRYSPEKYYIYIVKIERENHRVPSFVMRRYSEFQELQRKLEITFPLVQLPTLSGKIVLGRSHVRVVAENRKSELETFMKELLRLTPEVTKHDLIYTFFHPMLRDEQDVSKFNLLKFKEPQPVYDRSISRRIEGSIKLNLFYKQNTLTIMVMHVKDLGVTSSGEPPNPYVKLYMLPDLMKETKRKTRIVKHTFHPTYNEMLIYRMSLDILKERTLQATVWSCESLRENEFLGAVHIKLCELDLTRECPAWHKLQTLHIMTSS